MKRRRGIELVTPSDVPFGANPQNLTFSDIPGWAFLACQCARCNRTAPLDRNALARRFGKQSPIAIVQPRLRCGRCGNTQGNRLLVGKLPR